MQRFPSLVRVCCMARCPHVGHGLGTVSFGPNNMRLEGYNAARCQKGRLDQIEGSDAFDVVRLREHIQRLDFG